MKFNPWIEKIATATNSDRLRSHAMDGAGELIDAMAWGFELLNSNYRVIQSDLYGLSDNFALTYREVGLNGDLVSRRAIEQQIPVHTLSVQSLEQLHSSQLYRHVLRPYNIEHGMVAPLVGNGRVIGGFFWLRDGNYSAFNERDLIRSSCLCQHVSVRLATLNLTASASIQCLSTRELDIAELVAQGLTNQEIGLKLYISQETVKQSLKRMFRKLEVSARAEMVAKLKS